MNAQALESLNQRLRKLEDIEDIRTLRMSYHKFINEGLFDRFGELYTDDAVVEFDYVAKAKGIKEVRELFLRIPKNVDFVKQFIHNHMIEVNGDTATGLAYLDARYASNGEALIVGARFSEKYRRTQAGWRISETILKLYFSVPLSKGWAGTDIHHVQAYSK